MKRRPGKEKTGKKNEPQIKTMKWERRKRGRYRDGNRKVTKEGWIPKKERRTFRENRMKERRENQREGKRKMEIDCERSEVEKKEN